MNDIAKHGIATPTRDAGLDRLEAFVPRAGRAYAKSRNTDHGPDNRSNVSVLSPWLRHRLVLEEEVLRATLSRHSLSGAEKFVQEVFWRAYFKGWLEQHPAVWRRYRDAVERLATRLNDDADLRSRHEAATAGDTGIGCFDAWAGELVDTGYLHNHARMWFASIWVFTLGLPWELGADFFYRHLLDGDPASNTLSWRWVCGLHTRGKTYLARAENIARYTDGRFDPRGQLATGAPALQETETPDQVPLRDLPDKPPEGRYGLVITEEDCGPVTWPHREPPAAVIGLTATTHRSPLPVGTPARDFAGAAVEDALRRRAREYEVDTVFEAEPDWAHTLAEWAGQYRLDTLVTACAPEGPVSERLDEARRRLAGDGVRLIQVRRLYDTAAWPHATRGFFRLKKKIPALLDSLGIA